MKKEMQPQKLVRVKPRELLMISEVRMYMISHKPAEVFQQICVMVTLAERLGWMVHWRIELNGWR